MRKPIEIEYRDWSKCINIEIRDPEEAKDLLEAIEASLIRTISYELSQQDMKAVRTYATLCDNLHDAVDDMEAYLKKAAEQKEEEATHE